MSIDGKSHVLPGPTSKLSIIREAMDGLFGELFAYIEGYANMLLKKIVRLLFVLSMAVAGLAAGSIFLLIAFISYLRQFMPLWMAVGVDGVLALGMGGVLLAFFSQETAAFRSRAGMTRAVGTSETGAFKRRRGTRKPGRRKTAGRKRKRSVAWPR